jgi:predicted NUDIX family NTP pyrophosphohydrolase
VFIVHPGGPFWAKKDAGAWSIVKGEYGATEDPFVAARREFAEETGIAVDGKFIPLGDVIQKGGKIVTAWAVETDFDASALRSNTFEMEWPPRSGRRAEFPEIDRGEWVDLSAASARLIEAQREFLTRLIMELGSSA